MSDTDKPNHRPDWQGLIFGILGFSITIFGGVFFFIFSNIGEVDKDLQGHKYKMHYEDLKEENKQIIRRVNLLEERFAEDITQLEKRNYNLEQRNMNLSLSYAVIKEKVTRMESR